MSRRRRSQVRSRRRSPQLAVEGLEGRRLLAANVAVASDAWASSLPRVRLVDAETGVEQASVLAFESTFKGGVRVAMGRVTGNAAPDVVVGSGSGRVAEVRVFKPVTAGGKTTLTQVLSFKPFGDTYMGGIDVTVGNVDGDATEDIVVSKSRDGGDVKLFRITNAGGTPTQALYATIAKPFGSRYNGGASVGVADVGTFVDGALSSNALVDDKVEIVVASGAGIAPQVKVYDISKPSAPRVADTIVPAINVAYGAPYRGGLSVTSGRYNDDLIDDIFVSTRRGGGSQAIVYDGKVAETANAVLKSFTTYGSTERPNAAAFVAAVDTDGNGKIDRFLATQGDPGGPAGIANVSVAGTKAATPVGTLAGPLRIAAARTLLATQTVTGVTKVKSEGVPIGSTRSMQYRDTLVGSGAEAVNGKKLDVKYRGTLVDGREFDAGTLPNLTLGAGTVIVGWDVGLVGMKVGGKRTLVIPPELAYGDAGSGNLIKKGDTLVFDVELLSVT